MIVAAAAIVLALAVTGMSWLMRRQPERRALWQTALVIGVGTGVARAALASAGWFLVERDGGAVSSVAIALVMMAWPEGAALARGTGTVPPSFYLQLSLLVVTSTLALACLVALAAAKSGFGRARL
jgi:hypothetical protein